MVDVGVDIIDVGGESICFGVDEVLVDEEICCVVFVIEVIVDFDVFVFVDICKVVVGVVVFDVGVDIFNDVIGFEDFEMCFFVVE